MISSTLPGIYIRDQLVPDSTIRIDRSCVAGFVGIAERGEVDVPIRCSSFAEYQEHFGGFNGPGILPYAVYGFFNSGGRECVVVRTMHDGSSSTTHTATLALPDIDGNEAFQLQARTKGTWGNSLSFKLWYAMGESYKLVDLPHGISSELALTSTDNLLPGDFIGLSSENGQSIFSIKEIRENCIVLSKPVNFDLIQGIVPVLYTLQINCSMGRKDACEDFLWLSPNPLRKDFFLTIINARSKNVTIRCVNEQAVLPLELPRSCLSGGHDGVVDLEPSDFIGAYFGAGRGKGLGIFQGIEDIALLCIPDVCLFSGIKDKDSALNAIRTVQFAMVELAQQMPACFAILDVPHGGKIQDAVAWSRQFDSAYSALYYPHIRCIDPSDPAGLQTVLLPCSGHIAGLYGAQDHEYGSFHVPANLYIPGAISLSQVLNQQESEYLYESRVNPLKSIPGKGIKIWGARTLSSDPEWCFINVRRSFSRIAQALKHGTAWAVFEPNDQSLRKRLTRSISAFLIEMWREGYLVGKAPEQAFFVQCDQELNPPEYRDQGIMVTRIGLALSKPLEFLIINLEAEREGAQVQVKTIESL